MYSTHFFSIFRAVRHHLYKEMLVIGSLPPSREPVILYLHVFAVAFKRQIKMVTHVGKTRKTHTKKLLFLSKELYH